mgnify:CR=1 FL=1
MFEDQNEELRRAKRFEQKGLIAKVERLAVEVARDNARRTLVSAESDVDVAEAELMRQLRATSLPELSSPLFVLTGDLGTLEQWQNRADAQSPAIRKMNALRAQANEGISAAEASFKPKVYAFGTKNLIKHYLTLPEPDWMAGVGVTFTLWDNHDRFDKLNAARSVVTKAEAARSEAKNQVATAVEVAFLRVMQAREEFELTGSTVELARENLRLREASFAEGLSNAVDVDTARTKLTGAEVARRAAAYKFRRELGHAPRVRRRHARLRQLPYSQRPRGREVTQNTLFHRLDKMIEQTQAQQTQAQAPKRPASSVPLLVGGAFFAGIAAFLGWGVWEATHPAPVPLQGMVDARTISVSAKVPGRLAELKVREGDVLKAGDTVAVIAIPEIEAKLVQVKAQERAAQAREDLANTGARVQEKDAARADWERAKAALTLASKTYERVDALYREGPHPRPAP